MRTLVIALATVLLLSGCGMSARPAKPDTPPVAAPEQFAGVAVPDVVGLPGDEANNALKDAGFKVEFDAGDESVWMKSNWTVDGQDPAAGEAAEESSTVLLTVSRVVVEKAPAEMTSVGLTATSAIDACNTYSDAQFPYGYNGNWILGKLAEEIVNDEWFVEATATVKNEYGTKMKVEVDCTVAGTDEAPIVTSFNAY